MEFSFALCVALVAIPGDSNRAPGPGAERAAPQSQSTAGSEFRTSYLAAMRDSARRTNPDPLRAAPQLIALHQAVDQVEGLSSAERARVRRALEGRLGQMRDRLRRIVRPANRRGSSMAGPADTAQARRLIDLIQTTIAPETWDVNGGKGSIRYYSPLQVLVVRQTGEVHHQLGGVLGQLRR